MYVHRYVRICVLCMYACMHIYMYVDVICSGNSRNDFTRSPYDCFKPYTLYIDKLYTSFFITCIGSASGPAVDTDNVVTIKKKEECAKVVDTVFQLLEKRITAKQILTKKVRKYTKTHFIVVVVCNKVSF